MVQIHGVTNRNSVKRTNGNYSIISIFLDVIFDEVRHMGVFNKLQKMLEAVYIINKVIPDQ